jgi:hypothetical protein
MATPAQGPYAGPPAQKKTSPLVWIAAGVFGLILLMGTAVVIGGFFIAKKVGDFASNPGMAAAKLMVAANPDLELVSADEGGGTVTVREKKTGKVLTVSLDQIKDGKLTVTEDGKTVTIGGSAAGVEVKSSDGTAYRLGDAKLPSWIPAYPGSTPTGTASSRTDGEEQGTLTLTTSDAPDKVMTFCTDALKRAGLQNVQSSSAVIPGTNATTGSVIGESTDEKRSANIGVTSADGKTTAIITYSVKE